MTMQDIIYVLTIEEEKSFSKAAARLYVTQSAISQSISKLERELDVKLFFRTNKQVLPTKACTVFIAQAKPVVQMYQQFQLDMKQLKKTDREKIRIGVSSFFSRFLNFQKEIAASPQNNFEVEIIDNFSSVIEKMTVDRKVDFCFTRFPLNSKLLEHEHLFTDQIFLAVPASHPVCKQFQDSEETYPTIDLAMFSDSSFVMITNPAITHQCMEMCSDAGFTPHILASTTTWERVDVNVTELGLVGFISYVHAKPYVPGAQIRYFRINSPRAYQEHVVAYISKDELSPISCRYIEAFREYITSLIPK